MRTAQDRLVQTEKLASLGQLTAGIAHEIKNPLNFVNNFSAVSVELIDELREALGSAHLDSKLRVEIGEIADTLQGNLDKVVQHGKRADAIVKNMLLHSRQGSGEHRPVDINALVDESLNLAYHGARAEKQGFTITLERSFDPAAGEVDLFPQEITRALLNLISNGFYAATKRKAEANGGDYEPTLAAATKNLGDSVEIRIRDNGTGIPPEAREKLFNPFFTTKPAGEGTGLGLSISHDIIVKQHGGSIEVDTRTRRVHRISDRSAASGCGPYQIGRTRMNPASLSWSTMSVIRTVTSALFDNHTIKWLNKGGYLRWDQRGQGEAIISAVNALDRAALSICSSAVCGRAKRLRPLRAYMPRPDF